MPPIPKKVTGVVQHYNQPIVKTPAVAPHPILTGYVNAVRAYRGQPPLPANYGTATVKGGGGGGGGQPAIVSNPYAGIVKSVGPIMTEGQMLTRAKALAASSIDPELAAYNRQATLDRQQVSNQALRAQEYAKALGLLTAPQAGAMADQYRAAAAFEQGLGQGLTGDVAANWNAATQQASDVAKQMTGGLDIPNVGQYDPEAARSVAMLTGSSMPARALTDEGLNAYAMAQFARQANVAQVGDIAQQYLSKLTDLTGTQDAERAKILATRPTVQNQLLQNLETNRNNRITQLYNLANASQKAKTDAATLAVNWAAQQTKQQSADAYNNYLLGKTNLSTQELAWKKKYDSAKIASDKVKNMLAAAGLQVKKGQLVVAQQKAATAETTAQAKLYENPYTGKMEQIPAGTAIGKNGLPYDPTPPAGSTAKGKLPTLAAIQGTRKKMIDAANKRLHPGSPLTGKFGPVVWPKKRIVEYLMNQFGNDFLAAYPSQKTYLKQMIDSVANGVIAQYPKGK